MNTQNAGQGQVVEPIRLPPRRERLVLNLKAERVQETLQAMPAWKPTQDGWAVESVRTFADPETAAIFATCAVNLAGRAHRPLIVLQIGSRVMLTVFHLTKSGRMGKLDEATLNFAQGLG